MIVDLWKSFQRSQRVRIAGLFTFSTGRSLLADYDDQYGLYGQRLVYSILYGVVCTIPVVGAFEVYMKGVMRTEIHLRHKDPTKYPLAYQCGFGCTNPRLIW